MTDQNLNEFLDDEDFNNIFKQDEIEPQFQNIEPSQEIGINPYGHSGIYMERPKNLSIIENIHMPQAYKTVVDQSDDEEQDDNYRAIKNMTAHYLTHNEPEHIDDQWNGQNENQDNDFQDDIKFMVIQSGEGNLVKSSEVTGSAETMINKYQPHTPSNSGFSANSQTTKDLSNTNATTNPKLQPPTNLGMNQVLTNQSINQSSQQIISQPSQNPNQSSQNFNQLGSNINQISQNNNSQVLQNTNQGGGQSIINTPLNISQGDGQNLNQPLEQANVYLEPIEQQNTDNLSPSQQQLQIQQKVIKTQQLTSSQQTQAANKQGFRVKNREKNANTLGSSSLLQPKSMTNIDQQQQQNNQLSNSQYSQQQQLPHSSLASSDFRNNPIGINNLLSSINNGLDNSGLLNSINSGFQIRGQAQSIKLQEPANNNFLDYEKANQKMNFLGSSLVSNLTELQDQQQSQLLQQQQSLLQQQQQQQQQLQQQQNQILQQEQQQLQNQQQLQQNLQDNQMLKVKSEDCSSTNDQQPIQIQIPNAVNINNNNIGSNNLNSSINNNLNGSGQIPVNQIITPNQKQVQSKNSNNNNKKGQNANTVEIKKSSKKVEVLMHNNNNNIMNNTQTSNSLNPMAFLHQQQQQPQLIQPPQASQPQLHPQFSQNFIPQIPNQLNYPPNPNQQPPQLQVPAQTQQQQQQQTGYGYPYGQAQQPQTPFGQQPKNFLPPHYQNNPHLQTQFNQYMEQTAPHQQQNLLTQAALQNPYPQEYYDLHYGQISLNQLPTSQGAPQPQNGGYSDYMQNKFNPIPQYVYNQPYPSHAAGPQSHKNAPSVHPNHQNLQFFQQIPQINQQNGFNPGFPLNLRGQVNNNIPGSNNDLNASPFSTVQTQQQNQISAFKIKEEAQAKSVEDKNSSSSSNNNNNNNNNNINNTANNNTNNNNNNNSGYLNGSIIQQQNLNNSNQINGGINGSGQNNNIPNQFNMIAGQNQYNSIHLAKPGQQHLAYPDSLATQNPINDPMHQANTVLKLAQQSQPFLQNSLQLQHQQQQYLQQQNQFLQQAQLQQKQQQQQAMVMTNNNLEEESREGDEDEEENMNSEGNENQEVNPNGIKAKRPKNETKNIPKNYAKAFLRYIIDKDRIEDMKKILNQIDPSLEYDDIKKVAKTFKKNMNAIKDVRKIWQDDTNDRTRSISKFMRIASHQFLQKEAISYIFSSNKIKNSKSHIIYRHVMGLAMADPEKFNNIKSLYKNAYQD